MENKTIYELLSEVQAELKAPKDKYNSFGKYHYRSTEGIVEAVKPLLHARGMVLNISDWLEAVGTSVYVIAKATVYDKEGNSISATAGAREAIEQKGMADAQVTGSTSTYARKYALNGLFAIDDTKDSDDGIEPKKDNDSKPAAKNPVKQTETKPTNKPDSAIQPSEEFEGDLNLRRDWFKKYQTAKITDAALVKHLVLEHKIKDYTKIADLAQKAPLELVEKVYNELKK